MNDPLTFGHVSEVVVTEPARLDSYSVSIRGKEGLRVNSPVEALIRSRRVYRCHEIIVDVRSGVPRTPSGWILGDAHKTPMKIAGSDFASSLRLNPSARIEGPAHFLPLSEGYFHFLIENLPLALQITRAIPGIRLYSKNDIPPWQLAALDSFGLRLTRIAAEVVSVGELVVGTRQAGVPTRAELAALNGELLSRVDSDVGLPSRRLFVTRERHGRVTSLERRICDLAGDLGLETVDPATMSLEAQFRLFRQASLLVGSGGAALANMVWMKPGARIVILGESREGFGYSPYADLWSYLAHVSDHRHELWSDALTTSPTKWAEALESLHP